MAEGGHHPFGIDENEQHANASTNCTTNDDLQDEKNSSERQQNIWQPFVGDSTPLRTNCFNFPQNVRVNDQLQRLWQPFDHRTPAVCGTLFFYPWNRASIRQIWQPYKDDTDVNENPTSHKVGVEEVDSSVHIPTTTLPVSINTSDNGLPLSYPHCSPTFGSGHSHGYKRPFNFTNIYNSPAISCCSVTPLPPLKWGDPADVFEAMKKKDMARTRDANWLRRHPDLYPNVRTIILYWLMEVSEVYKLHRATFHLAVDLFDRYMSKTINIERTQVQLIGVTCLFSASKVEEIYPPKAESFAYMTDGLCNEHDITNQEIILLQTLSWELSPLTANCWLELYMQLLHYKIQFPYSTEETTLERTLFSGQTFVEISRLLEMCLLDIGCLRFTYGELAASVIHYYTDEHTVFEVSGFTPEQLYPCIYWTRPFSMIVKQLPRVHMRRFENVPSYEHHTIQTVEITQEMLEMAQEKARYLEKHDPQVAPALPESLLTPPSIRTPIHKF